MSAPDEDRRDHDERGEDDDTTQLVVLARPAELVPPEVRDASFSSALRGYDRGEVDAFVQRVGEMIAELEISRSPQHAVRRALDRVGEQTASILQEAREAAEDLTATAKAEAERLTRRARVEADELGDTARAESREMLELAARESDELLGRSRATLAQLQEQIERAREQHRRALGELRAVAAELEAFAAREELGSADAASAPEAEEQATAVIPAVGSVPGEAVASEAVARGAGADRAAEQAPAERGAAGAPGASRAARTKRPRAPRGENAGAA